MVSAAEEIPQVAKATSLDLSAFAARFESPRGSALRLAYAMTGDAGMAEDIVAEAFARAPTNGGSRARSTTPTHTSAGRW